MEGELLFWTEARTRDNGKRVWRIEVTGHVQREGTPVYGRGYHRVTKPVDGRAVERLGHVFHSRESWAKEVERLTRCGVRHAGHRDPRTGATR